MQRMRLLPLVVWGLLAASGVAEADPARTIVAWHYTVAPGDTLGSIARRMGVSIEALAEANGIAASAPLHPGQVLDRPSPAGAPKHAVASAPAPVSPRAEAHPDPAPSPEPLRNRPAQREPGAPRLGWPTSGALVSRYGAPVKGLPNNGVDLAAFAGMTVHAAAAGKVVFAGTEPERFGQLVLIDHGKGWITAYAYLGKVTVRAGQHVGAQSPIARIGASGEARKPTLHFELRKDNAPRDPLPYLPPRL